MLHWTDSNSLYGKAWITRWTDMWRSIGYAVERSQWEMSAEIHARW